MNFLQTVLKNITPSDAERTYVKQKLTAILEKLKTLPDVTCVVGGSYQKETWLSGNHDLDIFIQFPYKKYQHHSQTLATFIKKPLKKLFKSLTLVHGSRDYFQYQDDSLTIEFIPILKISKANQAHNITDVSPMHSIWINQFNFKDDIRLAKAFCKAQRVYGAESYIQGFSGYLIELLTLYYQGFENFIQAASQWKPKVVLDVEHHLKNPLQELNTSKIVSPLVVVDPVDPTRNVAAVVSDEKFNLFIQRAKAYLQKPSGSFFIVQPLKIPAGATVLHLQPLEGKRDVVGSKLLKAYTYLCQKLITEGCGLKKSGWNFESFWFVVTPLVLPPTKLIYGPPQSMKEALKAFEKKHGKASFKGKQSYVTVSRDVRDLRLFLQRLINDKNVASRVTSVTLE